MSISSRLLLLTMTGISLVCAPLVCRQAFSDAPSQNEETVQANENVQANESGQTKASNAGRHIPFPVQKVNGQTHSIQDSPVTDLRRTATDVSYFLEVFARADHTGTILGVHVSKASPALRKHLKLPPRFGLLVEYVEPGAAAADAKLQRFDVLFKFDDQLLVNQEQLTALVRRRKPMDKVSVALYRDGQLQELDVVLRSGQVVDDSSPDWKGSAVNPAEFRNHTSNPKFHNCHACHQHPFEGSRTWTDSSSE